MKLSLIFLFIFNINLYSQHCASKLELKDYWILPVFEMLKEGNLEVTDENREILMLVVKTLASDSKRFILQLISSRDYFRAEAIHRSALKNELDPFQGFIKQYFMERAREFISIKILVNVGLKDRLTHRPSELSGGEKQRVALARSLVMKPKLLLADEITGNLDTQNGRKIQDLLFEFNQNSGVTIIAVTHDEHFATRIKRKIELIDGKIFNVG